MRHQLAIKLITLILLLTNLSCHFACAQTTVRIASDDWCPYVCAENGQITGGFLVDVVTQAMQLRGIRVDSVLVPFSRAMNETANGNIQAIYSPPADPRLILSVPVIYARSCFYTLPDEPWTYRDLGSLNNTTLGAIADYNYDDSLLDDYIQRNRNNPQLVDMAYGEFAGMNNIKKLLAKRFTVMVEDEAVITVLIQKLQRNNDSKLALKQAGCLDNPIAVTIGFSRNDLHSDDWVKALNAGLRQLESSGRLAMLQRRYQIAPTSSRSGLSH